MSSSMSHPRFVVAGSNLRGDVYVDTVECTGTSPLPAEPVPLDGRMGEMSPDGCYRWIIPVTPSMTSSFGIET